MSMTPVHTITRDGKLYILASDIANVIRKLADTEDTDTRNRLDELAKNIENPKPL